ncbi:MAG: hypothetical protein CLLPBCKN_007533 [Chroococcidiopsis cubana SAG 39.79]|nr:hypothetical protein [Chroococcidiopsis cubana SAG 39.79]
MLSPIVDLSVGAVIETGGKPAHRPSKPDG